jgi:3-oxoadipate enol-lactonase/2-succinyl-6-hydroxy-2,4-cyclohexadiene-1-carboxylate synthase
MTPLRIAIDDAVLAAEQREGADGSRGVPLVLIHGFGGTRRDWDEVVDALPPQLPLIVYDQRGFGESRALAGEPYAQADDLLALLDALGIAQVDVCGMSLGGATALNFALDHPERIRSLVLVSPLMIGWAWSTDWVERWKAIGRAARAGDIAQARDLWWNHPLFDTARASPAAPLLRASIDAFHGNQWAEDIQRPALPDGDRLGALSAPTLLLTGAHDTEDFRRIAETIAAGAPDVTRIDHVDAGHMLNLEIPATIAAEIADFLSQR